MSTAHRPSPVAAALTAVGAILTFVALTRLNWGTFRHHPTYTFLEGRHDLIEEFSDRDFNATLQAAYASWGWVVMIVLVVGSFASLWRRQRLVNAALVVALLGVIGWHQSLISGLPLLRVAARLPMVGAAICCVGLLVQIVQTSRRTA